MAKGPRPYLQPRIRYVFTAFGGSHPAIGLTQRSRLYCMNSADPAAGVRQRIDEKALGVLPMSRGFALVLACGASLFSFGVQASPVFLPMQKAASDIILVWDWCGLGFHRSAYGYCIRNGTVAVAPAVVAPSAVVVTPAPVVAPLVCPSGYYLGPYGRCLLY